MPNRDPFVHLHFHTEYSLLDGACRIPKVMEKAAEMGMTSVAITDHGVMYGVIDFYKKAKSKGIKPILGCEVYMAHGSMYERTKGPGGSQSNHLVLLAEDETGYRNLQYLVSKAHLEGFYYKPRIDKELLAEHSEGLIGLSACLKGEVAEACYKETVDAAITKAGDYVDILGKDNFFIELQDHGIPEQRIANQGLVQVAQRMNLPLVATNDVHFLDRSHSAAHDVMICMQTGTVMTDPKRMRYGSDQFYMKSGQEMLALFPDHPEAISNTLTIAQRCNVDLRLGSEVYLPTYDTGDLSQKQFIVSEGYKGLQQRYGIQDPAHPANPDEQKVIERFQFEIGVIEKMGFINYFLVVWDFVDYARRQRIPVGPGRGSGAGSIVAYSLGITDIDPLQYNLIFERFLNPQRVSMPDFDIDFCQARRGEVIDYVKRKYGKENCAQIITFGTLGAKTVIRDVGRVLEVPFGECDRLAKMIPEDPSMTLAKAMDMNPEFKKAIQTEDNAKRIMQFATVLEGLPRNQGTHAAGVVIGSKPLHEILPLAKDKDGEAVTQFEMKPMEEVGLLKMDFLGLKTLTVIQEAVDNIKKTQDIDLDISKLPMDDEKTFALLNRGDTIGVFQVESKGMRDLLRRIGLSRFEDLIAMIALYRPGPMNMLDDFVNRKHGKVKLTYDHPLLEPVLEETYGVILYQEQVQLAANVLAGFTLGEGDILRRAMGKKIREEMLKVRDKFIDGCKTTNGIAEKLAGKIFDHIEQFAGYGFNKSHSAAYAILSIQTAYLKAHFPAEFMAALLSSEMGNTDKLPMLIAETQEMGIEVLPPDVNESEVRFFPVKGSIRFGMAGIKNVGAGAVEALVLERNEHGPFQGLTDFCARVDGKVCNKKVVESLVKCGAFDFCGMTRGRMFNGVEFAMSRAASLQRDRATGQTSLFDMLDSGTDSKEAEDELPDHPPWPESVMLSAEKELIGFYISGHPLMQYQWILENYSLANTQDLENVEPGTMTRIGGLVSQYRQVFTKKDQRPMAIFQLDHLHGSAEVVVFPDAYQPCKAVLHEEAAVMVCGELVKEDGAIKIKAAEAYAISHVSETFTQKVGLHIPATMIDDDTLAGVSTSLGRFPGNIPVVICIQYPSGQKIFVSTDKQHQVAPCHELVQELEHIVGEEGVYIGVNKQPLRYPDRAKKKRWGSDKPAATT